MYVENVVLARRLGIRAVLVLEQVLFTVCVELFLQSNFKKMIYEAGMTNCNMLLD